MSQRSPVDAGPRPRPRPYPSGDARPRPLPGSGRTAPAPGRHPSRRALLGAAVGAAGALVAAGVADDELTSRTVGLVPSGPVPPHGAGTSGAAVAEPLSARAATTHRHRLHPVRHLGDPARRDSGDGSAAVALTLDDGPHPVWTPRLLDLLERTGITATFFVIGSQVRRDPGLVREVVARGHAIGNHTWSHDEWLGLRPVARIRAEIDRTSDAVHAACGVAPAQFRAPGGNWQPRLLGVLAERSLLPVGWSVDTRDWARPGTRSIVVDLSRLRPRDIVLCHDGGGDRSQTWHALALAIPRLRRRGYHFVTVDDAT